jgi:hypothetical protein
MKKKGGFITRADLTRYKTVERQPIRADYRGWKYWVRRRPRHPAYIAQMLNILEGYDIAKLGFGSAETISLPRRGAQDRFLPIAPPRAATPDFINVPVERLTSKAYADERRRAIDSNRAQAWGAGVAQLESADTTHMTVADAFGNVVATTQTINNLFGAKILIPGLGTVLEQLHEPVRSASRPRAVAGARQARYHLDVTDDGAARRQARLRARSARREANLSKRDAGADQPDRSRHEPAGGGRGAAGLDRGQCARS